MRLLVTRWFRDVGDGMKFNHISSGYNQDHDEPAYVTEAQKRAWSGSIWSGLRAYLVNNEVTSNDGLTDLG